MYAVTTGPQPRIVAVVVTFNRLGLLETLVHRLGEIDGLAEVLVIDNAPPDERAREVCDGTFSIAQFGSTRSINASAAAAIAIHTWIRQHGDTAAG